MTEQAKPSHISRLRKGVPVFFRGMVGAYGLSIVLHLTIFLIFGERWAWIEFLNTFAQVMWIPVFVLMPICLFMREWRLSAMMFPALIAFIWLWGDLFLPKPDVIPQENDIAIRVLSYNMYANNSEVDAFINMIQEVDADIVALQELHYPQAEILATEFEEVYPYMAFHPDGTRGQGIMSRYPIEADEYWQYDFLNHPLGHQRVVLDMDNGTQIIIYNVHPTHPGMAVDGQFFNPEFRSREIAALLDRTSSETLPLLMVGDFNMPDFSADYRAVRTQFDDAFRNSGYGFGWSFPIAGSQNLPFLRLDYIFYTGSFIPQNVEVRRQITGSDHNGVYADLLIRSANTE